jgi:hypothetical protein
MNTLDASRDLVPLRMLSDWDLRRLVGWEIVRKSGFLPNRRMLEAAAQSRGFGSGVPSSVHIPNRESVHSIPTLHQRKGKA